MRLGSMDGLSEGVSVSGGVRSAFTTIVGVDDGAALG